MLRLSNSFLKSRLARRTLLLFVLSALLPIALLYVLTSYRVDDLYREQQQQELLRAAKSVGLLIHERIQFVRREARALLDEQSVSPDPGVVGAGDLENSVFSQVQVFSASKWPVSLAWLQERFNNTELGEVVTGGGRVLLADPVTGKVWMVMARPGRNSLRIFALQLSQTFLWKDLSDFDLTKEFQVYGAQGQQLFSSIVEHARADNNPSAPAQSKIWSLILHGFANANTWRIEAVDLQNANVFDRTEFQQLIKLTTLLATLFAGFISVNVIRRNLQPIDLLLQGIRRLNANRFDQPVTIRSGDEFELLGDTFNAMSSKLGRHVQAMQSLSKIDQLILNRLKIEDIVQVVLTEGRQLLCADRLHFVVADSVSGHYQVYTGDDDVREVLLESSAFDDVAGGSEITLARNAPLPGPLLDLLAGDSRLFYALIRQDSEVVAVLMAEFVDDLQDDMRAIANTFVDHIAVALNNADWEARLFKQAHYDLLTDLPNRYLFNDHLVQATNQARKSGQKLGLFFIDIDGFKTANDVFGHSAGDHLLSVMAARLSGHVESGSVYRLGGDEFVVLYSCLESEQRAVVRETGLLAEKLRSEAVRPIEYEGRSLEYSVSIGIAVYPDDSTIADELLKCADRAMYQAKSSGRNSFHYFSELYHSSSLDRERIVADLHRALARDEFELYFQPKVDLAGQTVDGCEALIRWNHPVQGFLGPGAFLPQAQAFGLIEDIGRWVIRRAALQSRAWREQGLDVGRIAVNVSVEQMQNKGFCNDVTNILQEVGCGGDALEFEITETAYADDLETFRDVLIKLKESGIVFSVDDYGTGYSSLSLLLKLPVSKVKIDKSFIENIETDRISWAIVDSTINLAREMGLAVIAEGVERPGQLALLQESHCDTIQGYLYSKPLPAEQFEHMYRQNWGLKAS